MKSLRSREPFDQFSRQYYISRLVNEAIRESGKTLSIVDLGGHKGNTSALFPDDEITILDVFDEHYHGYVKGDATDAPFEDGQFDLSTSFDVFEHIPQSRREAFVKESVRVARIGAFLAAPFDTADKLTSQAEREANALYAHVNKHDHRWLKEHIEYGIPVISEFEKLLSKLGFNYCRISSNPVNNWILMQSLIFSSTALGRDVKSVVDVNSFYNRNIEHLESGKSGYRSIYFISANKKTTDTITKKIELIGKTIHVDEGLRNQLTGKVFEAVVDMLTLLGDDKKYLQEKVSLLEEEIAELARSKEQLSRLRQSLSWRATRPLRLVARLLRK